MLQQVRVTEVKLIYKGKEGRQYYRYYAYITQNDGRREKRNLALRHPVKPKASEKDEVRYVKAKVKRIINQIQKEYDEDFLGLKDRSRLTKTYLEEHQKFIEVYGRDWGESERGIHNIAINHFKDFAPHTKVSQLNKQFSQEFYNYLLGLKKKDGQPINKNSATKYFTKYAQVCKNLFEEAVLPHHPTKDIKMKREEKKSAPFLNEDELTIAVRTPITKGYESIKRAFLLSCFTGLRLSDLQSLKWSNVKADSDGSVYIEKKMVKTKKTVAIYLNQNGIDLLGKRGNDDEKIFSSIYTSGYLNSKLEVWIKLECGINKSVTWHSGRHTFAYRFLRRTKDLVGLKELLGHSDIKTTMVYLDYVKEDTKKDLIEMPKL